MFKLFIISILLTGSFSCTNHKDEQFCKCLEESDKLDAYSAKLYDKVITADIQKEMVKLKIRKKSACKNYQKMAGEKMMELKAECSAQE